MAPALTLCGYVPSFLLHLRDLRWHMHIVPYVLTQSTFVWPCKSFKLHLLEEGQNYPIMRFTYSGLCNMISEMSLFLSFLYIKLFDLGGEVAFYNGSAVAHYKVNLLKYLRWDTCSEHTDDVCSFASPCFVSRNYSSLFAEVS